MIIFGAYKVARKQIAFANSFCRKCETRIVAFQWRYFLLGHLFFIPLLPLGFRRQWLCPQCGEPPLQRHQTSRLIKWSGAFAFGLLSLMMGFAVFFATDEIPEEDRGPMFGVFAVATLIAVGFFGSAMKHKPKASKQEALDSISETNFELCTLCQSPVKPTIPAQPHHCDSCELDVLGKHSVK